MSQAGWNKNLQRAEQKENKKIRMPDELNSNLNGVE